MMWSQLTDEQKIAHKAQVELAASELAMAEKAVAEAREFLTPGFPESWREDSFLQSCRAAESKAKKAFEHHYALLTKYSA